MSEFGSNKTNFFQKRQGTSFSEDVVKLVSGTSLAQVLAIIAAPFLTRLYSPDVWGTLALFIAISGILGVVTCLSYELSIMLPENDSEAANMLAVSLAFAAIFSLLSLPLVWWGKYPLTRCLNAPDLLFYLWFLPMMLLVQGFFLTLNCWNSRTRHFSRLSVAMVTNSLASVTGKLSLGYAGFATAGSMIGATVAGQAVATAILGGQIWKDDGNLFLKVINWRKMKEGIRRYMKFPLFSTWSALMNAISVQLPVILLALFFPPAVIGFYALGHSLLSIPMNLVGNAIAQVFFPRAAEAKNKGALLSLVRKTFIQLVSLGSFPLLIVMVAGKDIFSVIFGTQWADAGVYAQILSPWLLFVFWGSPISTLFNVLEMQGSGLLFNIILLLSRLTSLVAGGLSKSVVLALSLYTATGTVMWMWLCLYLLKKAGATPHLIFRDLSKVVITTLSALLPAIFVKILCLNSSVILVVCCFSVFFYYTLLYMFDDGLRKMIAENARRFHHII